MEEFKMVGRRTEPGKVFLEERGHGALGDDDGGIVQPCDTTLGLSLGPPPNDSLLSRRGEPSVCGGGVTVEGDL